MVMRKTTVVREVGVAELKAHLSEYLRGVREGEEVVVTDRDTPIAKIVPNTRKSRLVVRGPEPGAPPPSKIKFLPPIDLGGLDPVQILLEDRARR
jgi:prevent-host-death family protein